MDELTGSGFQNSNPISKKRRSITTRRRRTPSQEQEPNSPEQSQRAQFRKREFLLNTNTPPPSRRDRDRDRERVRDRDAPSKPTTATATATASGSGSLSAVYRRADTPNKNKVLTKLKVKVAGVSRIIHHHKEENLITSEPTRKSVRMNKRLRPVSDEGGPPHYEKPVADSANTKAKKKRLPKDLPSDGSTDYETGEEEDPAAVAAHVPHMEEGPKMRNLTSRQRAMLTGGKDTGTVEFPQGLPPAPSKKSKNKESEEEKQAKKAEAAQRRRLQVEKAAKESQEEAIRKILGLDSDRKKEEKKLKEKEEKERVANLQKFNGSSVKWVMGPTGTVVSFPDDVGLPCIFNSKPCGYPPPREKCAGPACNNAYRYRDSKSKLPLCSLECYRAVQEIA